MHACALAVLLASAMRAQVHELVGLFVQKKTTSKTATNIKKQKPTSKKTNIKKRFENKKTKNELKKNRKTTIFLQKKNT
jgi:uncharacterized Rossmann fold enzyme